MELIIQIISAVYNFLWGIFHNSSARGNSMGVSLLVLLLIPTGDLFHHPHPGHASAALSGDAPCDG